MRRLMFVSVAVAALAAAGCGGPLSPSQRSQLEKARARWESAGLTSYKRLMIDWLRKRIPIE